MTYSLAVCARTACVDVLAVREVALCVKYGHFGAQTLYRDAIDQQNLYIKKVMAFSKNGARDATNTPACSAPVGDYNGTLHTCSTAF